MANLIIREASQRDVSDILRAYSEAGISGDGAFTPEEAREHFGRFQLYPDYRIYMAEVDGVFAGTYALLIMDNLAKRGAKAGVVEDVAVLPSFQGKGVGRAMMDHARAQCRAACCYKMTLSSGLPREGAHRFYDSLGFERHGYSFLTRL